MKTRNTVIYFDGGEDYKGQFELTASMRKQWHEKAFEDGHNGYLSGYRYFDNKSDSVLVYFKTKPSEDEIDKRRRNGFKNARWTYLYTVKRDENKLVLNITERFNNADDMVDAVRHIANLIEEGYICGYDPDWSIK
jgi:hypothetical protein